MTPKIYVYDKVYIPLNVIDKEKVEENYTCRLYKDVLCKKCEYFIDRHSSMCDVCPAYVHKIHLFSYREINGNRYIGLPKGNKKFIEKRVGILYSDFKIIDKRKKIPFDYPIKFTLELRPAQKVLSKQFRRKKYGMIESPPRSGKTPFMLGELINMGYRCVLIADQHEFLDQFLSHIYGKKSAGIPKCTNLPELEEKYKKTLCGIPKTKEDFDTFQIMAMTYQSLNPRTPSGEKRLKWLCKNVGSVAVDEIHSAAAPLFSSILNKLPATYIFGGTGTAKRKDGREKILKQIVGPVVARSDVESMTPTVYIHDTNITFNYSPKTFIANMQKLAKSKERNALILKYVLQDLKAGHSIVIPVMFKNHVFELVNLINEAYGRNVADYFIGGQSQKTRRKETIDQILSGKIRVIVGIRRLLQRGLNIPNWSAIYTVMPISNEPNYKQETRRICTPLEGKNPIVRLFYEECSGWSVGCAKSCVRHLKSFKYNFSSDKNTVKAIEMFNQSRRKDIVAEEKASLTSLFG